MPSGASARPHVCQWVVRVLSLWTLCYWKSPRAGAVASVPAGAMATGGQRPATSSHPEPRSGRPPQSVAVHPCPPDTIGRSDPGSSHIHTAAAAQHPRAAARSWLPVGSSRPPPAPSGQWPRRSWQPQSPRWCGNGPPPSTPIFPQLPPPKKQPPASHHEPALPPASAPPPAPAAAAQPGAAPREAAAATSRRRQFPQPHSSRQRPPAPRPGDPRLLLLPLPLRCRGECRCGGVRPVPLFMWFCAGEAGASGPHGH